MADHQAGELLAGVDSHMTAMARGYGVEMKIRQAWEEKTAGAA